MSEKRNAAEERLLPCPFCGGEADKRPFEVQGEQELAISCVRCQISLCTGDEWNVNGKRGTLEQLWNGELSRSSRTGGETIKSDNSKVNENLLAENERLKDILDFLGVELLPDGEFQYKPSRMDKWAKVQRDAEFQNMRSELARAIAEKEACSFVLKETQASIVAERKTFTSRLDEARKEAERLKEELNRCRWTDGIWLVQNKEYGNEASLITKIADLPNPAEFGAIARHKDAIGKAMMALWRTKWQTLKDLEMVSTSEFTETILEAIAEALKENVDTQRLR